MTRPVLLDGCCGGGLASDGYRRAGFDLLGVDLEPQPHYPYAFMRADVLEVLEAPPAGVDAIHVSPPCQAHTRARHLRDAQGGESRFADVLTPTLERVRTLDLPWVVENVPGAAHLMLPRDGEHLAMLCGSMFGLMVQRHRLFLSNVPISAPAPCDHSTFEPDPITGKPRPWGCYHTPGDSIPSGGRTCRDAAHARECMGVARDVPWATMKEGLPPAYTAHLGRQMLEHVGVPAGSPTLL